VVARVGGGNQAPPRRDLISARFPGHPVPLQFVNFNQSDLSGMMAAAGAIGFKTAGGVSRRLADLPQTGDVEMVLAEPFKEEAQVRLSFKFALPCLPHCEVEMAIRSLYIPLPNWLVSPLRLLCVVQVGTHTALPVAAISPARIKELAALMHTLASTEHPGATTTALQEEPFNGEVRAGARFCSWPCVRIPRQALLLL
jgi:hypothetical protein